MNKILIYSDGGARGNPGPAAYGFVIKAIENSKSQILNSKQIPNPKFKTIKEKKFIGIATNNQAEYQGVLSALKHLKLKVKSEKFPLSADQRIAEKIDEVVCYLDSQLIVEQMKGNYKIKNEGLKPLYWEIRQLIMDLGNKVSFEHITRDKNIEADKLVNEAIDKYLKK